MTPQVFRGTTLDEAQRLAREALGADAVILTARKVQKRGLRGLFGGVDIEVSAQPPAPLPPPPPPAPRPAVDAPASTRGPFASSAYSAEPVRRESVAPPSPRPPVVSGRVDVRPMANVAARVAPPQQALEDELASLRDAVDRLSEPSLPRSGALAKMLRETGLEGRAAQELLKNLKHTGNGAPHADALRDAMSDMFACTPWPLIEQGPALIALVGPSGVGKTTTAAKVAARAMHELHKSVTFVTCDGVRVGAFEQIDRYADLLGARIVPARSPADLQRAVESAETDLVIVDTAGRSPTRLDAPERALKALPGQRGGRARMVLLTLPASIRADDAARFAKEFALTRPTAMAITKLDETVVPAGILHGAVAAKLPLSVLCFGQNVPEDIAPATTGAILDYLLPKGASRRKQS